MSVLSSSTPASNQLEHPASNSYLSDVVRSVQHAIEMDPQRSPEARKMLLASYHALRLPAAG
jgi:hypothetical protein